MLGYVLIKGPACFVFSSETAPSPKYAIPLDGKKAVVTDSHENNVTVILQDALGDPEYRFIFDQTNDKELASRFVRAVGNQAVVSHIIHEKKVRISHFIVDNAFLFSWLTHNLILQRLGHKVNLRASTMYASEIASKKEKDQPEKPTSAADVLQNIPTAY